MKSSEERRLERQQVKEIALSEKHLKLRTVLFVVFLVIGLTSLGIFLFSILRTDPGWQTVTSTSTVYTSASDFSFNYYCGANGADPSKEYSAVTKLYTEAAEKAYVLFDKYDEDEELFNVYYLNHNVNKTVTVDPVLYNAFKLLQDNGSRVLYLAPVYEEYDALFGSDGDALAQECDPYTNAEVAARLERMVSFAASEKHVQLQLLADNKVCLFVSDEYKAYAEEVGIVSYIDFYRYRNAFIADYLASVLIESGYTHGYLSSNDGFMRNLDDRGEEYSLNLINRNGKTVHIAATVNYKKPLNSVMLYAYPLSAYDNDYCYEYENGKVATSYISVEDGLYKTALPNLFAYSRDKGCAEMLVSLLPYYIADSFGDDAVGFAQDNGIDLFWFTGETLNYTESGVNISAILQNESFKYVSKQYTGK